MCYEVQSKDQPFCRQWESSWECIQLLVAHTTMLEDKPSWHEGNAICWSPAPSCLFLGYVSVPAFLCLFVNMFARWIVVFNPWYSCFGNLLFVAWQKWLQSVGVSLLWESQESVFLARAFRPFLSLLTSILCCHLEGGEEQLTEQFVGLTGSEMAYLGPKAWSWKTKKHFQSKILVSVTRDSSRLQLIENYWCFICMCTLIN